MCVYLCDLLTVFSNSSQLGPPLSLQELLERQWEQTAQFILDQAGRQNNGKIIVYSFYILFAEHNKAYFYTFHFVLYCKSLFSYSWYYVGSPS